MVATQGSQCHDNIYRSVLRMSDDSVPKKLLLSLKGANLLASHIKGRLGIKKKTEEIKSKLRIKT